jgi:hypothetical protein
MTLLFPHLTLPDPSRASLAVMLFGMGLLALWFVLGIRQMCFAAQSWPIARGEIIESGTTERAPTGRSAGAVTRRRRVFRARTLYAYRAGGIAYRSDRISFGMHASFRAIARRQAGRLAAGSNVEVRYNPFNPAEAVLFPTAPGAGLLWTACVLLFAAGARVAGLI